MNSMARQQKVRMRKRKRNKKLARISDFSIRKEKKTIEKADVLYFKCNIPDEIHTKCTKKEDDFYPSFFVWRWFFEENRKNDC